MIWNHCSTLWALKIHFHNKSLANMSKYNQLDYFFVQYSNIMNIWKHSLTLDSTYHATCWIKCGIRLARALTTIYTSNNKKRTAKRCRGHFKQQFTLYLNIILKIKVLTGKIYPNVTWTMHLVYLNNSSTLFLCFLPKHLLINIFNLNVGCTH